MFILSQELLCVCVSHALPVRSFTKENWEWAYLGQVTWTGQSDSPHHRTPCQVYKLGKSPGKKYCTSLACFCAPPPYFIIHYYYYYILFCFQFLNWSYLNLQVLLLILLPPPLEWEERGTGKASSCMVLSCKLDINYDTYIIDNFSWRMGTWISGRVI